MSLPAGSGRDRVVTLPFNVIVAVDLSKVANTAVFSELEIVPANLGTRVSAAAALFEYYRVSKLQIRAFSSVVAPTHYDSAILNVSLGVIGGIMAHGYVPSDAARTGTPSTLGGVMNSSVVNAGNLHANLKTAIPKKELLGTPLKWWNTTSTGTPTETYVQGLIYLYNYNKQTNDAAVADTVYTWLSGEIQLKGMIDPTLSMAPHGVDSSAMDVDYVSVREEKTSVRQGTEVGRGAKLYRP